MKTCPLCAEEIQDAAMRCKHCGGDLEKYALEQNNRKLEEAAILKTESRNKTILIALGIVGGICGLASSLAVTNSPLKLVGGIAISALLFPISWKLGSAFGKLAQPDFISAQGVADLAFKRILYYFLPLAFAIVGGVASLYVTAAIVGDSKSQNDSNSRDVTVAPKSLESKTSLPETPALARPSEQTVAASTSVANPTAAQITDPAAAPSQLAQQQQLSSVPSPSCTDRKLKIFNARQSNKFEVADKIATLQGKQFTTPSNQEFLLWQNEAKKTAISTCAAELDSLESGKPSFDCSAAKTRGELMICDSKELAGLDTQLSNAFYAHKYFSSDKNAMLLETRAWLSERNNCLDADCLKRMYKQRIQDVESRMQ